MHGARSMCRSVAGLLLAGLVAVGLGACADGAAPERPSAATSPPVASSEPTPPSGDAAAAARSDAEVGLARLLRDLGAQDRGSQGAVVSFDAAALFDPGSAELTSAGKAALGEVVEALTLLGDAPVRIHGHSAGAGEDSRVFAHRRAAAIAVHVVEEGISADRLSADGFAGSEAERVEVVLPTVDLRALPSP